MGAHDTAQPPGAQPDPAMLATIRGHIDDWARELGFGAVGVADIDLAQAEARLKTWLARGFHGDMAYMARHGERRTRPAELVPGSVRVICVRMDYLPPQSENAWSVIGQSQLGFVSRYALGRDYHKVVRSRLQQLATRIESLIGPFGYRVFCDSAPVMEKPLAEKAGLGWMGKHSNILARDAGSWFFLGEIYVDLPLAVDRPVAEHCGKCTACIDICPTGAIVEPYVVDARRCISYLTIEHQGSIPLDLRPLLGNRIYGCDDCQLVCPWNRFAKTTELSDFAVRESLDAPRLVDLFAWSEGEFLRRTQGSAIRRIGWNRWLRNIAVALGNAGPSLTIQRALARRRQHPSSLVREHVAWAIVRQRTEKPD